MSSSSDVEDVAAGGKNLSTTPALVFPSCTCGMMLIALRFEDDLADILHIADGLYGKLLDDNSSLM